MRASCAEHASRERRLTRWSALVLRRLGRLWEIDLGDARVVFSPRMTRNLGRCYLQQAEIRLNPRLAEAAYRELLRETLVHEAAHLAAWRRGQTRRPHQGLWPGLMRSAGFPARAVLDPGPDWPSGRQATVELRCTTCGWVSLRRRTDRRWRCRHCLGAGRSGILEARRIT